MIHNNEIYPNAQAVSGLKIGDTVKITRAARSYEHEWNNSWTGTMDCHIGITSQIHSMRSTGIQLTGGNGYLYPYFVLEKIVKDCANCKYWDIIEITT